MLSIARATRHKKAPRGLYAEQLSGSAFTAPRLPTSNVVRITASARPQARPRLSRSGSRPRPHRPMPHESTCRSHRCDGIPLHPGRAPCTFLSGLRTICTAGDVYMQAGMASHVYVANQSMNDDYFYNADGEMLLVPQENTIRVFTECGIIDAGPATSSLFRRA